MKTFKQYLKENNMNPNWLFDTDLFAPDENEIDENKQLDKIKTLSEKMFTKEIKKLNDYISSEKTKVYKDNDKKIKYTNEVDAPKEYWHGDITSINKIKKTKRIKQTEELVKSLQFANKKIQDLAAKSELLDFKDLILNSEKKSKNITGSLSVDEKISISFAIALTNGNYDEFHPVFLELFNGIKDIIFDV